MRIAPFQYEHFEALFPLLTQAEQDFIDAQGDRQTVIQSIADSGPVFSLIHDEGVCAIGGVVNQNIGEDIAWTIIASGLSTGEIRSMIIQMVVCLTKLEARYPRLVTTCGVTPEGQPDTRHKKLLNFLGFMRCGDKHGRPLYSRIAQTNMAGVN